MATIEELMKKADKTYGVGVMQKGLKIVECERIPTGIFPLDLSLGGGFPVGKISEIFGPESSGKTNICLKAIAQFQKIYPDQNVVFVDCENALDPGWASTLGVDVEKMYVVHPSHAEATVDIVEGALSATNVGLVVVDSIASMITTTEIEKSAEGTVMGGNSVVVGKLIKKSIVAQTLAAVAGRYPTLLCVNQTRYKLGVMFGDPETTPGGNAPRFHASIRLRCYGKNIMENSISKTMPVWKQTNTVIKKWKVPIVSVNCEFKMATLPMEGCHVGSSDDWNTLISYAKNYGILVKGEGATKGWLMGELPFPTVVAAKEYLEAHPDELRELKAHLIQLAVCDASGIPEELNEGTPSEA